MYYRISDSKDGYRNIELTENPTVETVNAKMSLRLINNVINLSYVECNIPSLRGSCFKEFMKILVKTAMNGKLFEQKLSPKTMVELFVFPSNIKNSEAEEKAIQKIKHKYAESGFVEEENNLMSASLCTINETINNGDISKCISKQKSISNKSYMSSTSSSRSKQRLAKGKRTKKRICK